MEHEDWSPVVAEQQRANDRRTVDALVAALEASNKALWQEGYTVAHPVVKQIDAALALARGGNNG